MNGTASRSAAAAHVRKVAEELGYRRNSFASSLRRGETRTLGVLVPRLSDTVMALMFEELERAASDRGYFAMVATSGDDPDDERRAAETLLDRNVDGLILATARLDDELPKRLRERRVAHALVLRTDGVSPPRSATTKWAVTWRSAISSILGTATSRWSPARPLPPPGWPASPARAGRWRRQASRPRKSGCIAAGYGIENGFAPGKPCWAAAAPPQRRFRRQRQPRHGHHRRRPPLPEPSWDEDLALVGYNDIPLSSRLATPLTSVRVPLDQIAGNAIDLIVNPGKEPQIRKSMPTLIPRESSGSPQHRRD